MKKSKFDITVITLTKNNHNELRETLNSIYEQETEKLMEILIIDGSDFEIFKLNKEFIKVKKNIINKKINVNHINAIENKALGIYGSMNFGINKSLGEFIIFMNSGDLFYNRDSIMKLYNGIKLLNEELSFCFGQAEIISKIGITWFLPGKNIKDINRWLQFMLPNHQSMMVSRRLAFKVKFNELCYSGADGIWKRELFISANKWTFIREPVAKFYIGGLSTSRPKFYQLKIHLKNKYLSKIEKIIYIAKFFIPVPFYKYVAFLQKIKLKIIENIFIKFI